MKNNYKRTILRMLSNDLEYFYPELKDHFMCPTCLKEIPTSKIESISEAHIIPKAAGGKFKTFTCRKCNSDFGTNQDKWFGELIRLSQSEKSSIMETTIKDGHFEIDGVKINGRWEINNDGNFNFLIYKNHNSPKVCALISEKLKSSSPKINLSFSLPLMRNKRLIDVGFLTAGYLMWFSYFGYSWVFQSHLDLIRKQILNPKDEVINVNYIATCNDIDCEPWIGFLPINNDIVLTFGVGPHIAIMPPRYNPTFYSSMDTFTLNLNISEIRTIKSQKKQHITEPVGIMFEDKVLVLPDMLHKTINSISIIRFTKQNNATETFRPVSEDEYGKILMLPNVTRHSIKLQN